MRRFRFPLRLRTALVLVAVAASAMGAVRLARLRAEYLNRAEFHAAQEADERDVEATCDRYIEADKGIEDVRIEGLGVTYGAFYRENQAQAHAHVEYHATLRRKYERATSRPWLSVPPDPPKPFTDGGLSTRSEWEMQRRKYPWLPERPAEGFYEGPPPQPIQWQPPIPWRL